MRGSRTLAQCLAASALLTASLVTIPVIAVADPPASGPGSLTASFGDGGIAALPAPSGSGAMHSLNRMYVQSDGKVLVGALTNVSHQTVVYRLNADGSLDTGFGGGNGYIVDAHAISSGEADAAIGEDAAGNVYVGGGVDANGGSALFLSRYDSNGAADATYGTAGTSVISSLINVFGANPVNDHITDLVAGPNGSMLATAWVGQDGGADFVVLRFTPTGALDPTFGAPVIEGSGRLGYVSTNFHSGDDTARSLALQSDGKIVVAGFVKAADSGPDNVGLARYTAAGALDTTFGVSGKAETDFAGGFADGAWSVDVAADDTISVAATDYHSNQAVVARYSADGALETSFNSTNNTGKGLRDTFGADNASGFAITHDNDGRLLLAGPGNVSVGTSATSPGVDRLVDAAYPLDTTWNSTGRETLSCTTDDASGAAVATTVAGDVLTSYSCGGRIEVASLKGGNDVNVSSAPTYGTPDAPGAGVRISNVSVNQGSNVAKVAGGASYTVDLDYFIVNAINPNDIDQIQLGYPNDMPTTCAYDGVEGAAGASGHYTGTFVAPAKRGSYYLASGFSEQFSCNAATLGWQPGQPGPAQYIAKITVGGVTSISISSDRSTAPAGHLATRTKDIPGSALQTAGTDIQAAPLRSTPLRSTPLRSTPLRSTPLRSTTIPIPLSDAPLVAPKSWTDVLDAPPSDPSYGPNPYADQPLQNVTLQQVLSLPAGHYPAVDALTLDDIDWSQVSQARNLSLAAFLLGDTPLSHLPPPSGGWCSYLSGKTLDCGSSSTFPDSHSLADVQLAGDDVSSYLSSTDIPLTGTALVNSALPGMVLVDVQLSMTPFGDVPAGSYASCGSCTFAQAEASDTSGLSTTATIGDLLGDSAMPSVTLGDLLPGLIPASELPYDQVPLSVVVNHSLQPAPADLVTYTVDVGLDCVAADTLQVGVQLPPGFDYQAGSASLTVDSGSVGDVQVTDATADNLTYDSLALVGPLRRAVVASAPVTCSGPTAAHLTLEAEPGVTLGGPFTAIAAASFEQSSISAVGAGVTVVDQQPPAPASTDTIYLGHISQPGEIDRYAIAGGSTGFAAGSQITVSLTNVPSGDDFDLVLYGPQASELRSSPLRSTPLRSTPLRSTTVGDNSLDPQSDGTTSPPDPQADVPIDPPSGQVFWSSSINRGSGSESLNAVVGDAETGDFTIQVSGYNGSWSTSPYMLRVSVTPPATPLPCATVTKPFDGQGSAGSLPSTPLPTTTETLVLVDKKRLGDFYGSADADRVMSSLQTFAARSDVKGVVVPVEGDGTVAAAYAAWDQSSCSPAAADGVVAAINALVDRLRTNLTQLRYVVIVGDDQIIPFARVVDHTAVSNESDYGAAAAFDGHDNAISRSLADGYLLTDDAYASFSPIPWMESSLYVPNVASGRLVETPDDIVNALTAFGSANGVRSPTAGFTTGYDFMTSEANAIDTTLAHNLSAIGSTGSTSSQINETWSKTDAITGISAAAHGFLALNAHYDNYRALPAGEFTNGTENQLLTTADLPSSMAGGIMFTIGCHAGLNLADTFVASPTAAQSAKLLDWAQAVGHNGGQLVGNTGFGYGDTDTIAYSAALMVQLATNLDGSMTLGQALMYAKQAYLHLPMGVYDAKALQEATFYGLPMYRLGANGHEAPPALPDVVTTSTSPTTVAGSPQSASFDGSADMSLVAKTPPSGNGTYFVVHHTGANTDDKPLVVQNETVEPQTTINHAPRTDGLVAHGVVLDSLSTRTTSSTDSFNPVFDRPTVDQSAFTPEPQIDDAFFPATIDGLVSSRTPAGPKDTVVLTPGQFRGTGNNRGFQVLASQMGYHLVYSDSPDFTPPTILSTTGTVASDGAHVGFDVAVLDDDVASVTVLYLAQSSTGAQPWTKVDLVSTDAHTWTAYVPYTGPSQIGQYIVQAVDTSGNATESANKGRDFTAVQPPVGDSAAPVISATGSQTGGIFTSDATITITGGSGSLSDSVDNAAFHGYSGQFHVTGDGTHLVTARDSTGATSTAVIVISTAPPTVTITSPRDGATYFYGSVPAAAWSCQSNVGIATCTPTPAALDTSLGQHTFSVTGTDNLGRPTTSHVTYTVGKWYTFKGFYAPLPNLGGASTSYYNVVKAGSSVPMKWNLYDDRSNGAIVSDVGSVAGVGVRQPVSCQSGLATDPVDFTVTATTSVVRWDATAQQFIYVWNTAKAWGGTCARITFTFADTTQAFALFQFK